MIKFTVNTEARTVTAAIEGCENDAIRRIEKQMGCKADDNIVRAAKMKGSFSAVAKCHPNDIFDEEEGKLVAKRKLLNKYNEAKVKAFGRADKVIDTYPNYTMVEINRLVELCKSHN